VAGEAQQSLEEDNVNETLRKETRNVRYLKLVLLAGLILALAAPASAVTLTNGPQEAKFNDWTSLYRVPPPPPQPVPPFMQPAPRPGQIAEPLLHPGGAQIVPIFPGDENRAIFDISTITPDVLPAPAPDFTGDPAVEQLSGLFYDLHSIAPAVPPAPGGSVTVDYGSLGRNPVVAGSGTGIVPPVGSGGAIEIWQDVGTASTFNPLAANALGAGPLAWDEADSLGLVGAPLGHAVGPDAFPTVNQSGESLWLQVVFIPFPGAGLVGSGVPAGSLVRETFTNIGGSTSGSGSGFGMVVGGSYAPMIAGFPGAVGSQQGKYDDAWDLADDGLLNGSIGGPAGFRADLFVRFDVDPDELGAPPWLAVSDDPVKFAVVPEPVTMLSALFGLGGLAGYLRKRR
jgi:hypothetical protein